MEAQSFLQSDVTIDPFEQSVINKKASLPANQIVTKEYVLDIKPLIKFILKGDMQKQQENISYIPPRVKNAEYDRYGQQFHPTDFLGYKYAEQFDQMIYFRYNNQLFNELHDKSSGKGTRYFAGLYIPLQALQSNQFKAEDNIYNALNLSAPQIKDSIAQSFAKNSKGCSFDPFFSSNFTSGNMMAAIRKKPFQYDIILQQDTNCKAAEWFNFAVKFIQEGTYTFNIVNLSNQIPLYEKGMKIPYFSFLQQSTKPQSAQTLKPGHGWSFGGMNIKFSKTDTRKQNKSIDQTYFCLSFDYKCKKRQQIVVFASSIPYTSLDYERFLNRVIFGKVSQNMKMQKIQIGQTLAGSPLSAYIFYHRKSKSKTLLMKSISQQRILQSNLPSERRKTINLSSQTSTTFLPSISQNSSVTKSIVFLARQHSGQTSSSFVLEGIIDFLMDNAEFDMSKKNFQFVIIPLVNPDGVKYGNQRVNLAGSDLNKSWANPNEVFEPEVYQVKKWLKNMNEIHPISLLINLSSNNHTLSSYFKFNSNNKYCEEMPQLFPYLISKRVPQVSFQKSQIGSLQKQSLVNSLSEVFPKALVYDFTTSSFGWNSQNLLQKKFTECKIDKNEQMKINEFTPEIYRGMGKELISTYLEYVRLCQRNIGVQDRWIKEIKELAHRNLHYIENQDNLEEKKYELGWEKDLILMDYPVPNPLKPQTQKKDGIKHKTSLQYRFIGGNLSQANRQRQKKLTMPFLKRISSLKEQKENSQKTSIMTSFNPIDTSKANSQMDSLFSQQKEIKEIILRQKDKFQMADKTQFKGNENKIANGFVKFQTMKKSIPALGLRTQSKRA